MTREPEERARKAIENMSNREHPARLTYLDEYYGDWGSSVVLITDKNMEDLKNGIPLLHFNGEYSTFILHEREKDKYNIGEKVDEKK